MYIIRRGGGVIYHYEPEDFVIRAVRAERSWRSYPSRSQNSLRWERRGRRSTPNIQGRTTLGRSKKVGDTILIVSFGLDLGRCRGHRVSPSGTNIANWSPRSSSIGTLSHWSTTVYTNICHSCNSLNPPSS
eukprot:Gb_38858 [translate_table: standard]